VLAHSDHVSIRQRGHDPLTDRVSVKTDRQ
jgi:hypothetical protein